jgi:hypothetical protein
MRQPPIPSRLNESQYLLAWGFLRVISADVAPTSLKCGQPSSHDRQLYDHYGDMPVK